jgi:hypothetical protein
MLFNSTDKWWGDQGKRDQPHEGLDLCLYKDGKNTILSLGEKAEVPVIFDGEEKTLAYGCEEYINTIDYFK